MQHCGSADALGGKSIDCAAECCRGAPEGDSRRARESGNGNHHVSAVQRAGAKSSSEVVRSRASDEITSSIEPAGDRKSTRLNSSHLVISYAVFCLKKKKREL